MFAMNMNSVSEIEGMGQVQYTAHCSRPDKRLNSILRCVKEEARLLQVESIMAVELLYLVNDNSGFLNQNQP
jgi:hypothetical protein